MKKTIGRNLGFRPVLVPRSINLKNQMQSCSNSACRSAVHSADPFDNMKYNENSKPSLRPILNKHRKSPTGFLEEKQIRPLLKISSSVSNLPTIFKVSTRSRPLLKRRPDIPVILNAKIKIESRNVITPYFNAQEKFKSYEFSKKTLKKERRNMLPEVSFGDLENNDLNI